MGNKKSQLTPFRGVSWLMIWTAYLARRSAANSLPQYGGTKKADGNLSRFTIGQYLQQVAVVTTPCQCAFLCMKV